MLLLIEGNKTEASAYLTRLATWVINWETDSWVAKTEEDGSAKGFAGGSSFDLAFIGGEVALEELSRATLLKPKRWDQYVCHRRRF